MRAKRSEYIVGGETSRVGVSQHAGCEGTEPTLVLTRREVDRIVSVLDEGIGEIGRALAS